MILKAQKGIKIDDRSKIIPLTGKHCGIIITIVYLVNNMYEANGMI
jgi:hypothetical protein